MLDIREREREIERETLSRRILSIIPLGISGARVTTHRSNAANVKSPYISSLPHTPTLSFALDCITLQRGENQCKTRSEHDAPPGFTALIEDPLPSSLHRGSGYPASACNTRTVLPTAFNQGTTSTTSASSLQWD